MKHTIARTLAYTKNAMRPAVILTVSLAMFLFAACEMDTPPGQRDTGTLTGPQAPNASLSKGASITASAVPLGTASTFAVLGFAGATNAAASVITGDLGVGPAAPSATGFDLINNTIVYGPGGTVTTGLGIVNGTIYAGGPVEAQAYNDAVIAYNYLAAQVPTTIYSGDGYQLDGLTFTPGVYKFDPSANLKVGGTLYLDFQGNPDALFIFQMGTTLVTMANSNVIALNTGNTTCVGSNVYWAVGSSATIDGAQFVGTVIAKVTITMTSAANTSGVTNVSGRMFALGASVTMVNSIISVCGSGGVIPPPEPPKPCRDFVTGGGWINDNGKATFGVSGGIKNGKFWGQLSFNDHQKNGVRVKSTKITAYIYIDAVTRQIEGEAKVNGQGSYAFKVVVVDKGEPGRTDSFSLDISSIGYSVSGTLKGGNIQLHTKCGESDGDDKEKYDDKHERDGHKKCDDGDDGRDGRKDRDGRD